MASDYLEEGQQVVLIEQRPRYGGMWTTPIRSSACTSRMGCSPPGSIPWRGNRPRSYLATRQEILDHFADILDVVRSTSEARRALWVGVHRAREHDGRVLVQARNADGEQLEVDAARLIKGFGIEVRPDAPLEFTSDRVRSIGPSAIVERRDEIYGGNEPIWIVGAGKTGMDTAHQLVTKAPGREVNMIIGGGTFFGKRDRLFPDGRERWRPQATPNMLQAAVARRFDGTNEADVRRWLRDKYGIGPVAEANNYFYGILSEAENEKIARGVTSTVRDYLADVRDLDGRPELVFRSGATREVPAGTWVVNCSGLITPVDRPYEPYSSPSGNVLTLSLRSATVLLSSFMAYFMTHLMYRDKLTTTPLYQVDYSELAKVAKPASPYVMAALAQYNLCVFSEALPLRVFLDCGLDFDRWMPVPHRVAANLAFAARHRRDRPRMGAALDTVRDRFGVRCGPLEFASVSAPPAQASRGTRCDEAQLPDST